jgi:DsbC/DsbD-like thiol-disulfide interchange protein
MSRYASESGLLSIAAILAWGVVFAAPVWAALSPSDKHHATVELISEKTGVVPGSVANLGLSFTIEKNWHLYWLGRNDTGTPPTAEFVFPEGYAAEPWKWPAPERHVLPGDILDHVYFDHVTLIVPVKVPANAKPGTNVTIKAHVQWLVCERVCVAEECDVAITLPVVEAGSTSLNTPQTGLISAAIARMPQPLLNDPKAISIGWTKDRVEIKAPESVETTFFPAEDCLELTDPICEAAATGDTLSMRTTTSSSHPGLRGVLQVRKKSEKEPRFYLIDSQPHQTINPNKEKSAPNPSRQ